MAKRKPAGAEPDSEKPAKLTYAEQVANRLIEQLKQGTAPWQRPWVAGEIQMPHNPVSGTKYKGSNLVWLSMDGRSDPRWMTYKQAASIGAQVRAGEKGTMVQYWKFKDEIAVRDAAGKPVVDGEGKKVYRLVELDRPKCFHSYVFNAEQIDGLKPLERAPVLPAWERHERAEALLQASGADIRHDQASRAFYRPATDRIHLPPRDQFPDPDGYYSTALHEVGHWTGHKTRLDRDLANPFGSEGYAKEELRAEIASLMVGEQLGLGHDPGNHAAYVAHWIKTLQEDPMEIIRASKDADRITAYVMDLEREREPVVEAPSPGAPAVPPRAPEPGPGPAAPVVEAPSPGAPAVPPRAPEPGPGPAAPVAPSAVTPTWREHISPQAERLMQAISDRNLKAAVDVLQPLGIADAKRVAMEAGFSVAATAKTKAEFFADIQSPLIRAARDGYHHNATRGPLQSHEVEPGRHVEVRQIGEYLDRLGVPDSQNRLLQQALTATIRPNGDSLPVGDLLRGVASAPSVPATARMNAEAALRSHDAASQPNERDSRASYVPPTRDAESRER
jgi:antirestriction protein ArdC